MNKPDTAKAFGMLLEKASDFYIRDISVKPLIPWEEWTIDIIYKNVIDEHFVTLDSVTRFLEGK